MFFSNDADAMNATNYIPKMSPYATHFVKITFYSSTNTSK